MRPATMRFMPELPNLDFALLELVSGANAGHTVRTLHSQVEERGNACDGMLRTLRGNNWAVPHSFSDACGDLFPQVGVGKVPIKESDSEPWSSR